MAVSMGTTNDSPENITLPVPLFVTSGLSLINQSEDEDQLLRDINVKKANLLLPAILVTVCLMILGLVGNPLAIYIYGWRWQPSSTKVFLFSLAVIDLMNCLITIPTEITIMINFYNFHSDGLCKVSRFTTYVMNNATSAIFLAIAVDRYIRICHPYRIAVSARRAKIACGIGLMIGLTVSWPALFIYGRINLKVPAGLDPNSPPVYVNAFMCIVHADMSQYSLAFFVYLCVAFFFCTLILVVFYTLIGRAILKRKRLSRMRKETTAATLETFGGATPVMTVKNGCVRGSNGVDSAGPGGSKRDKGLTPNSSRPTSSSSPRPPAKREKATVTPEDESQHGCNMQNISFRCKKLRPHRATLTMFSITVVYITSFVPFLIISIIRQHRGPAFYLGLSSREEVAVSIFIRSYIVNNCTNPIVYGLCNSQFREECRRLWWRLCRRSGNGGGGGGPNVAQSNSRQNSFANRSRTLFEPTPRLERKISPEP